MRTQGKIRRNRILRCLLAMALAVMLAVPVLAFPQKAEASSNITSACNLTWDELKPHLEEGLGVPYLFGGAAMSGWDCSGYASWAFNTFGGQNYTHYTTSFENELRAKGCFVMEGGANDLRDSRMEPGDIIFLYSAGVSEPTHMGIIGERADGIVMVYHAFTNSFSDIYGNSGTMLQGLDANPGSSLAGIWSMSSGHGKGSWSKFTVYRGVSNTGSVSLTKASANETLSVNNENYSLEGAVYGLYSSRSHAQGNVDAIAWLVTDKAGHAQVDDIKCGTYYIKETEPSPGFALDENIYPVEVPSGNVVDVSVSETPQRSPVKVWLLKTDAETGRANAQGDASLAQAQFEFTFYGGRFSSRAEAESAAQNGIAKRTLVMQTDEQGKISFSDAKATFDIHNENGVKTATLPYFVSGDSLFFDDGQLCLPLGTVFVRETAAPSGYLLDESPERIVGITAEGTTPLVAAFEAPSVSEQVLRGGISVGKIDRETSEHNALGNATLKGASFCITNNSTRPVVVNGTEYQPGQVVITLKTDENGLAATASNALPFGTYTVTETEAPEGYLLDVQSKAWSKTVHIRESKTYDLTSPANSVSDQVKRGDIAFSKVDGKTMERMAKVPFSITSTTSGETHVVVTDENGAVDTSSSWNAHTRNTNANDVFLAEGDLAKIDSECGLWFSGRGDIATKANDGLGALPYDTYRIEELRCTANTGKELLSFEITVKRDKAKLDLGTLDNSASPAIRTTFTNADGDHMAAASTQVKLFDEVEYEGLTPGKTYTLQGEIHLVGTDTDGAPNDGGPVTDPAGEPIVSTVSFSPETEHGTAQVEFVFDASQLAGKRIVAFERLMDNDKQVAEHSDPADSNQTVAFPEIKTSLAEQSQESAEESTGTRTLIDTVEYHGLVSDKTYLLNAELHIRAADGSDAGIAKNANGNPITAKQAFAPSEADGSVEVAFTFNAPNLAGETVVAFEKLERNEITLAAHADISDDNQSLSFPKIETTAWAKATGDKNLPATSSAEIIDTVAYSNLNPGTEYRLAATVHLAESGENSVPRDGGAIANGDGETLMTEVTFTPDQPSGEAEVPLSLDATKLAGRNLVVFERCYQGQTLVASHEDIASGGQTVSVPSVSTEARDKATGSHIGNDDAPTTIVDTVRYENLAPGVGYEIEGVLHVAETNESDDATDEGALIAKGSEPVCATASFTPESADGEIELGFSFDSKGLDGKTVVAFETLKQGDTVLAEHADINDKNQSVSFPTKPEPIKEQSIVEKAKAAFAKTGDSVLFAIAMLIAAGATGAIAVIAAASNKRKRP